MNKKSLVAAVMAYLLAGSALASGGGEVSYTPRTNVPESAVLDGLSFKAVVIKTYRVRNAQHGGLGEEKLSFEPELLAWARDAMGKMGFQLTGNDADPLFSLRVQCFESGCGVVSGIRRDTYLPRTEGGRQYFLKIPDRAVAEYSTSAGSQLADVDAAQREAAFKAVRDALQAMAAHVAQANSPEAQAQYRHWFEGAARSSPQGASTKVGRPKPVAPR